MNYSWGALVLTFPTPARECVLVVEFFHHQMFVFGIDRPSRPSTPLTVSLFRRVSTVDADAANGVPPDASETLTLGVEYSLVSVVYLIWGGAHYVTQFRLQGKWLEYMRLL